MPMSLRFSKIDRKLYFDSKLDAIWAVPAGLLLCAGWFYGLGYVVSWLWNITIYRFFVPAPPLDVYTAWGAMIVVWLIFNAPFAPLRLARFFKKKPD